jgi:glycosyltransferase involved in cell wall biosynthesis
MNRIAICWPRFGPYHLARLDATAHSLGPEYQVFGVETDIHDKTYAWESSAQVDRSWVRKRCDTADSLRKALHEIAPNFLFVNGWGFRDSRTVFWWGLKRRIPIILFSDSQSTDQKRIFWRERIKKFFVSKCSAAIVAGSSHRAYLVALGMKSENVFEGLDVVDNDYFSEACKEAERLPLIQREVGDSLYFLFVGRLIEKKNLSGLIRSYHALVRSSQEAVWKLVIAGDGPERETLISLVQGLGLTEKIIFIPFQQYDCLPSLYKFAACLILPSAFNEQWGLVVNEAMATGLPVLVSTKSGCASSLVRHGENGFTFDPTSIDDLSDSLQRIARLTEFERITMGNCSRRLISEWSLEKFASSVHLSLQTARSATK